MVETRVPTNGLIPPALLEQIEALAAAEHRAASEILREAIEGYLHDHGSLNAPAEVKAAEAQPKPTPQEAVARILELRKGNKLPEGMTIRDLQTFRRP